ncbi:MAG TPA: hemerythrin domain-containing protein [Burkholderiaceae bacterium]|nr:hemerythrin domain-containing protein [Burkholderiaceae bacterium]
MTKIPGFDSPSAGFDSPLELLAACHERIQRHCATLRRLAAHLATHGSDADARSAAEGVLRYFDTAARDHHADEERDLFPALHEALAGSDPICVRELTDALTHEHRALEAAWVRLRDPLQRIAAGEPAMLAPADVDAPVSLYERHLEREDGELLPMAERLLDDAQLARLGQAMSERRGLRHG